jgi:UTP--glucose-1-phosphate uridylyltransferase
MENPRMNEVRKVVFPVAGRGTRMLPATRVIPKEMLPLIDRPLIAYGVDEAVASGIDELVFVISRGKEALVEHFAADNHRISVVVQEEQRGLGHAIWCARDIVGDEPFAVILPDDVIVGDAPCIGQLLDTHMRVGGNIVAVQEVSRSETASYGILDVERDDGRIAKCRGLVEKPQPEVAPSTLSIVGRYILEPGIFDALSKGIVGAGNEIQITDAIDARIDRTPLHGLRFDGVRYDCGRKEGLLEATVALALARPDLARTMELIIAAHVGDAADQVRSDRAA